MIRAASAFGIAIVLLALFCDKPPHVDDTLFLARAQAMALDPPFASSSLLNWHGSDEPFTAASGFMNPPVWPWLLAGFGYIQRGDEISHWWQVPFLALALFCMASLGRQMRVGAPIIMALAGITPIIWISSTTFMPDLPCLALGLLALVLMSRRRQRSRIAGGVALFAAGAMKFSVLPLYVLALPLAPLPALVSGCATLLWPVSNWIADSQGGHNFAALAMRWELAWHPAFLFAKGAYGIATLSAGVVFPGVFWYLALCKTRWQDMASLLWRLGAVIGALLLAGWCGGWQALRLPGTHLSKVPADWNAAWFAISIAGFSLWLVGLLVQRRQRHWHHTRWLLTWIAAVWFASLIASQPATRYLLFAAPALILLVLGELRRTAPRRAYPWVIAALLASCGWLGLNLVWSDDLFARCTRSLVAHVWETHQLDHRRVFTTGHWGLQHEVVKRHGHMLDNRRTVLAAGDMVLIPTVTYRHRMGVARRGITMRLVESVSCGPVTRRLQTIRPGLSASFYGGTVWLPYVFSEEQYEQLHIFEVVKP